MNNQPGKVTVSHARAVVTAVAAYSALAVWFTWPLALHPGSLVPSDLGDPVLNTWILWWNAHHVPLTAAWWNAPIFFPADHALAFSEHLLGLTPIAAPVIWLSRNPLLGYNVTFLLTFVLSALSAFLLVLVLTERRDAAFLAGLAFGFAPYRVAQWPHLQVLAAFWMPAALIGLHRFTMTARRRWLVLFFVAFVMQSLSNGYYLAFFSILVGLWVIWFCRTVTWRGRVDIAAAWVAGFAVLLPILLTYREVHAQYGLTRNLENMRLYSADVAAWFSASPNLRWWGWLPSYGTSEGALFTGTTIVALVLAGLVVSFTARTDASGPPWRSAFAFYVVAAVILYLFALGPSPSLFGKPLGVPGPYAWLTSLPGFSSLRAPARLGMLSMLCIATAGALAYCRISRTWPSRRRFAAMLVVACAMAAESWPRALPVADPPRTWALDDRDGTGPLLVLPMLNELNEAASMYRSMFHGRPLVNGYSGHIPPWYLPLKEALDERDPSVLDEVARVGVTTIALVTRNDPGGSWREFVLTHADPVRESAEGFALFHLHPPAARPAPGTHLKPQALHASMRTELTPLMLDDRADTWWSTARPQSGGEDLILELAPGQRVAGIELENGGTGFEYPRRLEISVSEDSVTWTDVWRGPTAGLAAGALMQRGARQPIRFRFAEQTARYVRLRQAGRHRSAPWSVAEIRALGPALAATPPSTREPDRSSSRDPRQ